MKRPNGSWSHYSCGDMEVLIEQQLIGWRVTNSFGSNHWILRKKEAFAWYRSTIEYMELKLKAEQK